MKKVILSILICNLSFENCTVAQTYINIVKDFDSLKNADGCIKYFNGQYYFTNASILNSGNIQFPNVKGELRKFDNGFFVIKTFNEPFYRYYQSFRNTITINKSFIYNTFSFDKFPGTDSLLSGGFLYKYNLFGDTIIKKVYIDIINKTYVNSNLKLVNNTLLHFGTKASRPYSTYKLNDVWMMITDTNLNILYTKQYGVGTNNYDVSVFTPTHDGGFLAGGYYQQRLPDSIHISYPKFFLQKYDSTLTLQWTKFWNDTLVDYWGDKFYNNQITGLVELGNNNIFVCGISGLYSVGFGFEYYAILDPQGNVIKQKHYANTDETNDNVQNYEPKQKANGNVVTFGNSLTSASGYVYAATIKEIDANLNIVNNWRYYSPRENYKAFFGSWDTTPDGGYVLLGHLLSYQDPNDQDIWLLKIDSNMCANTLCGPTAVEELVLPKQDIEVRLYPNPASNLLNIRSPQPIQKIEIYNAQGQVVQTIPCNSIVNYQLIIVNYNSGIYFYTLTFANKSSARGKFMIQK